MPLAELDCSGNDVSDLSPLRGVPLKSLGCSGTLVTDLSPLQGMGLENVRCASTRVTELSPLKGLSLKALMCDFKPERDADILRSIKTLEEINFRPAAQFWEDVDRSRAAEEAVMRARSAGTLPRGR